VEWRDSSSGRNGLWLNFTHLPDDVNSLVAQFRGAFALTLARRRRASSRASALPFRKADRLAYQQGAGTGEPGKERNFTGEDLCARGYAVSTVGFELEQSASPSASRKKRMEPVDNFESMTKARLGATPKLLGDRL